MMTQPGQWGAPMPRKPAPLSVVVIVVVLCLQAGYSPQDLHAILITLVPILAVLAVTAPAAAAE
ncbi:hypothetical protein AB0M94_07710 [Streptomyces xanthochromogenes]|uniref:hypothetical protein n=1 Tax=Streptomyces xanthochromogenes TaxID=67384 RepID=UPI0034458787